MIPRNPYRYRRIANSRAAIFLPSSAGVLAVLLYFRGDLEGSLFNVFIAAAAGVLVGSLIGVLVLTKLPRARKRPKVGLVVARFNKMESDPVAERLGEGARQALEELGVPPANIVRLDVPGAWELPWGARRLIQEGCQGVVATAVVLQGETRHFESVVEGAIQGLIHLQVETGVPVGNGVLAVSDWEQAQVRSRPGSNLGAQAARAVMECLRAEIR